MPAVERLTIAQARVAIAAAPKRKRHKYGAKAVTVDGNYFPSKLEARRYGVLRMLERSGQIRALKLQPRFPLEVNGVMVGEYRADFAYRERNKTDSGEHDVVEDAKCAVLPLYKLKRALFLALHPLTDFREIRK